jgi:protein TonB
VAPGVARSREGRAPVRDRLLAMLLLAALAHAIVLLGVGFRAALPALRGRTPELDVLLVTDEVPDAQSNARAAYLAQRTQLGAGNSDQVQPIASPSSRGAPVPSRGAGNAQGTAGARDTAAATRELLATSGESPDIRYVGAAVAQAAADMPWMTADSEGAPRSGRGDAVELLLRGQSDAQHWVTPDTRASRLAPYLVSWKRKVERIGTLNFPAVARTAGLSGSPVLEVQIQADGRLLAATVRRSSGHTSLDEAAMAILKLASPFDPFPPDLADEYSRLRFAYQWEFVAGSMRSGAVTVSSDTRSRP